MPTSPLTPMPAPRSDRTEVPEPQAWVALAEGTHPLPLSWGHRGTPPSWLHEEVRFSLEVGGLFRVAVAAGLLLRHVRLQLPSGSGLPGLLKAREVRDHHLCPEPCAWVVGLSPEALEMLEDLACQDLWASESEEDPQEMLLARDRASAVYRVLLRRGVGQRLGAAIAGWDRLMAPAIERRLREGGAPGSWAPQLVWAGLEDPDHWWGAFALPS